MIQRLIPPVIHRHWFTQLVLSGGGATVSLGAAAAPGSATAKALGITVPLPLSGRADEVIE